MKDSARRRGPAVGVFGFVLILAVAGPASADLVLFKDGYVLEGQSKRKSVMEFDKVARLMVDIPQGAVFLDDGPRRMYFSNTQVRIVERKGPPTEERIRDPKDIRFLVNPRLGLPPILKVIEEPPFDSAWKRQLVFHSQRFPTFKLKQRLGLITPYWARVDAIEKVYISSAYLTREFGPETVKALLDANPSFQEKPGMSADAVATLRMRKCDFYAQAGWYDFAESEMDRLLKEQPQQKERIESARKTLHDLRRRDLFQEIKHRHQAGQTEAVTKLLASFPEKDAPERILSRLRQLRSENERLMSSLDRSQKQLTACMKRAMGPEARRLIPAVETILKELNTASVGRLDAFLGQAEQAQRDRRAGRAPEMHDAQLLALAVTGWLQGSPAAEPDPAAAARLWRARDLVLDYQRTEDADKRAQLLKDFLKESQGAALDEIVQMIRLLPPAEAEKELKKTPIRMTVKGPLGSGANYLLQLPPEYTHNRSYPVLFVLHDEGETPSTMLKRWTEAAEQGYLVVAPDWQKGGGGAYDYSADKHDIVLGTLRDLRRRFQIDSDRVFLFGLGQGGEMAFDVGLSHPSAFAGVMPMATSLKWFSARYWRNAQNLPFYVVTGNLIGPENYKQIEKGFTDWMIGSFPSLWIVYKGRGNEWFGGEVPNLLDWMRVQRRQLPTERIGFGVANQLGWDFKTMRDSDNRFYWLEASEIHPACKTDRWNPGKTPATLRAHIDRGENKIYLDTRGLTKITIWLGRNAQGQDQIDFDRLVSVVHNLRPLQSNFRVKPSPATLLEDLYQRGDRQQLFLAKLVYSLR